MPLGIGVEWPDHQGHLGGPAGRQSGEIVGIVNGDSTSTTPFDAGGQAREKRKGEKRLGGRGIGADYGNKQGGLKAHKAGPCDPVALASRPKGSKGSRKNQKGKDQGTERQGWEPNERDDGGGPRGRGVPGESVPFHSVFRGPAGHLCACVIGVLLVRNISSTREEKTRPGHDALHGPQRRLATGYIAWPGAGLLEGDESALVCVCARLRVSEPAVGEAWPEEVSERSRACGLVGVRARGTMSASMAGPEAWWGRDEEPWLGWGRGLTGSLDKQVRGQTPCWERSMRMQRAWRKSQRDVWG